jgi:ABC-2 type transport system permease protein
MSPQPSASDTSQRWRSYSVAFQTILVKETRRYLRIWVQTLVPPAVTMTLYLVIFGSLVGSRIPSLDGHHYMDYIVPGVIMMSVITNAYSNVVSSFFSGKFQGYLEELLVAPVPSAVILLGYVAGGVGRGLLVGLLVTGVAEVLTDIRLAHPLITLSVVFLTAVVFSLAGFTNALFARNFDDISIVPNFVLTPLTYFGGVFYSVSMLPEFWQYLSLANPILYMVNAFRYGFLGSSDIPLAAAYSLMLTLIAALFSLNMYWLNRGIGIRN